MLFMKTCLKELTQVLSKLKHFGSSPEFPNTPWLPKYTIREIPSSILLHGWQMYGKKLLLPPVPMKKNEHYQTQVELRKHLRPQLNRV
jgi:hypothetical protein